MHALRVTHEALPRSVVAVGDGFWNLRGSFKIAGVLDIGTQASLVRRPGGGFVMLDACELDDETARWVWDTTQGGQALEAILHLHPFHTLHVRSMHARFPHARLYGTARHARRAPELAWDDEHTDDDALHARFADTLEFSVPRGVELIPDNENLHFASVLAFHPASRTLHVDDTLNYVRLPKALHAIRKDVLRFHPTLARVLEARADASREFEAWARELVQRTRDVDNLCAAHGAVLLGRKNQGRPVSERIERALGKLERTLHKHAQKHAG